MNKNKKGYSTLIALLIVGFLLILVVGVFNLVFKEYNSTRTIGDYYKAYYGAEAGQELALLEIKEKGYGVDSLLDFSINNQSVILSKNPLDKDLFNSKRDVYIGYNLNTKTNAYSGTLNILEYDIIPLFYIENNTLQEYKINDLDFEIISGNNDDLAWNIIGKDGLGISGIGDFDGNKIVKIKNNSLNIISKSDILVKDFLNSYNTNYLILFNTSDSNIIDYSLETINSLEFFTKPKTHIISRAKIGNYKQNISTYLNNTKYLNILKYSIHSSDL